MEISLTKKLNFKDSPLFRRTFMVFTSILVILLTTDYETDNAIMYYILGLFFLVFGVVLLFKKENQLQRKKSD